MNVFDDTWRARGLLRGDIVLKYWRTRCLLSVDHALGGGPLLKYWRAHSLHRQDNVLGGGL
jgi:hypothetical protein